MGLRTLSLVAVFALVGGVAVAQDIHGPWDLRVRVRVSELGGPEGTGYDCEYEAISELAQEGNMVSGEPVFDLKSGDYELCPDQLSGSLSGTVEGGKFLGVITGELGTLDFDATVFEEESGLEDEEYVRGTFRVLEGPFYRTDGYFAARRPVLLPALGGPAVALLAMVLLAGGSVLAARRRRA